MIDAVHRYDGYVVQSTGDGIFALFGAPVAYEDHPQRGLYAALQDAAGVARARRASERRARLPLRRASASTPAKWWCARSRPAGHTEYTPIGHTANLASRLQTLAPAGSIAVSEQTRRLVEGYFELPRAGADGGQGNQRADRSL